MHCKQNNSQDAYRKKTEQRLSVINTVIRSVTPGSEAGPKPDPLNFPCQLVVADKRVIFHTHTLNHVEEF